MRTLTDFLIEKRKREEKYFKNYLFWAKKIKKLLEKELGEGKVFLFGSVVKREAEPGSDIDVLIVASQFEDPLKRSEFYLKVNRKVGFLSPFEIHLITPKEYKEWYQYFIKEKIEIK
jgi:uncharacterized protein